MKKLQNWEGEPKEICIHIYVFRTQCCTYKYDITLCADWISISGYYWGIVPARLTFCYWIEFVIWSWTIAIGGYWLGLTSTRRRCDVFQLHRHRHRRCTPIECITTGLGTWADDYYYHGCHCRTRAFYIIERLVGTTTNNNNNNNMTCPVWLQRPFANESFCDKAIGE